MKKLFFSLLLLFTTSSFAAQQVEFETTAGNFTIELNEQQAPVTTANFIKYVKDGSYVGTIFHRIIPDFMAQGGGFDEEMTQRPSYDPIVNEATNGLENLTATVAMARTPNPNSATRQFFINLKDNEALNYSRNSAGYAVFGQVTQGFDVIQAMSQRPTHSLGRMQDVPVTPIVITKATLK